MSLLISLSIESNRHSRDGKAKPGPIDVNLNISLNEPTQCWKLPHICCLNLQDEDRMCLQQIEVEES